MLLRGTKRQLRHDTAATARNAIDQLHLPWISSIQNSDIARNQRARWTTTSIERRTISLPQSPLSRPQSPSLRPGISRGRSYAAHATSTDYFSHGSMGDEFIPFDTGSIGPSRTSTPFPWPSQGHSLSELPLLDPSSPLVMPDSLRMGHRTFRTQRGVGGSLHDIHLVLRACLQLGQLERAALMVRRLGEIYRENSSQLLEAHNGYLGAIVDKLAVGEDQTLLDHMNRWFEVEMKAKGVIPDELTFAMLTRATFFCGNHKWVGRSVRRLMDTANHYNIYEEAREAALAQLTHEEALRFAEYDPNLSKDDIEEIEEPIAAVQPSTESQALKSRADGLLNKVIQAQRQRGYGLTTLHESLKSLPSLSELQAIASSEDIDPVKLQLQIEEDTIESAIKRWHMEHEEMIKTLGIHQGLYKKPVGALMWNWYEALLANIKHDLVNQDSFQLTPDIGVEEDKSLLYLPLLQQVSPEKLAATTIVTALQSLASKAAVEMSLAMSKVVMRIGKSIESESLAEEVKRNAKSTKVKNLSKIVRSEQHKMHAKQKDTQIIQTEDSDTPLWSPNAQLRVGVKLVTLLMKSANIEVAGENGEMTEVPAFQQSMDYAQGRKTGLIGLHPSMIEMLRTEPVGSTIAKHLPMVSEPLPWTAHRRGGYLKQPVAAVRTTYPSLQSQEYVKLASKKGDMTQVYAALDVLGKTPWRINRGVYDVMVDVWNSGEALASVPPRDPQPNYPPNPRPDASLADKLNYSRQCRKIDNEITGFHSNRCFQNFQLEVARAYLGKRMFFPHNMDFRGRAYPIPPYLNHMGADNCRGLLQFDEGKELGVRGLFWLKVHLANLSGFDKASLKERENFAVEHFEDIKDSARNPLSGNRWWLKAEDPWQCLACCIELTNALESPNPTKYISHQPVHQDGTCNGLQHYAALGGDPMGAKQVNLEPGDRPSDIYTAVAEMAASSIAKDAAEGDELAKILDGKVTRKVVKQTVMTKVYGVTFSGARLQVLKRLDELYPGLFPDAGNASKAASYIAKKIFGTLSIMFNGAQDIQLWFGECASRICDSLSEAQVDWIERDAASANEEPFKIRPTNKKSTLDENMRFKNSVIWTTPLKMPVVQPYRSEKAKHVETNLQNITIYEPSFSDPVHKRRQLQAFPPNFIHSLDATHMFLTALKSHEQGLTFAAVHDSFWTHAGDIDTMNTTIRDSFIRMHSDNVIARLAAEFNARYRGSWYRAAIKSTSPLGKKIKALRKSRATTAGRIAKGSRQTTVSEILEERQRVRLLKSKNAADRAAGKAMMTPGRLFEEAEAEDQAAPDTKDKLEAIFGADETAEVLTEAKDAIIEADDVVADGVDPLETTGLTPNPIKEDDPKLKLKKGSNSSMLYIWRPLTFPAMPQRGTFDVNRLRESKYFFS